MCGHPPAIMQQCAEKYTILIVYLTYVTMHNTSRCSYFQCVYHSNWYAGTVHSLILQSYCIDVVGLYLRGYINDRSFHNHLHTTSAFICTLLHTSAYNVCIHLHTLAHVCMLCTSTACLHHIFLHRCLAYDACIQSLSPCVYVLQHTYMQF